MIDFMKDVQTIKVGGHPFAVISQRKWKKIQELLENLSDLRAYDRGMAAWKKDNYRTYPDAIVRKIVLDGEHPVAVLRAWRGMSQAQLAKKAGLNPLTISHIETGVRKGGITALRKIADALNVSLDMLTMKP